MATSSILTNVVIKDSKKAEVLANALEASSRDPKRKPSAPTIPVLTDVDAVRRFLHRNGRNSEQLCSHEYFGFYGCDWRGQFEGCPL